MSLTSTSIREMDPDFTVTSKLSYGFLGLKHSLDLSNTTDLTVIATDRNGDDCSVSYHGVTFMPTNDQTQWAFVFKSQIPWKTLD